MSRPQKYNPALGFQGNIENALWENQYRKNEIFNECSERTSGDIHNRVDVEQSLTEADIKQVEIEQTLTEVDLRLIALESKEE